MTTITLTPDLEAALSTQARGRGTTVELLALDILRAQSLPASPIDEEYSDGSLFDSLQDRIGVPDSREFVPGGARLSEETGTKFAAAMEQKRQEGRL